MTEIHETRLPGVGIRFDFTTRAGRRLGIIVHRSGRREFLIYATDDPDVSSDVIRLDEDEVHALAELLGQSQVTEDVGSMRLQLQGLVIDWLPVKSEAACAACTVHDAEHQDEEPATIVAVLRGGQTIPAPPSTFMLEPGDTAVVVGTPAGVAALSENLSQG
jgi:TrkA domain protein